MCNSYHYEPIQHVPFHAASVVISNGSGYARNTFLEKLEKKMPIWYGGNYKNNIGGTIQGSYHSNAIIDFYKKTKFVITMENSREEHYVTEKIINGFRAGTIPIYWGSPHVTKYFNPKRFLALDHVSDDAIIQLIDKIVNMSDEDYLSIINEPIFTIPIDVLFDTIVNRITLLLQ